MSSKSRQKKVIVQPHDAGYEVVAYPPFDKDAGWNDLVSENDFKIRYRKTSPVQTLYASYRPGLQNSGRYQIDVFIPSKHTTTGSAQYHVRYMDNNEVREKVTVISQKDYKNKWVSLGVFTIDLSKDPESGRVNLIDLTGDSEIKEIAFGPIRWQRVSPKVDDSGITPIKSRQKMAIVQPYSAGYHVIAHPPFDKEAGWSDLIGENDYKIRYRKTSQSQTLFATYRPDALEAGRYMIDAFIPNTHATTSSAQYHIYYHENGELRKRIVSVNQAKYFNDWVSLGEFPIDPDIDPNSGTVHLLDLTFDQTIKEIAFGPIRWQAYAAKGPGFDSPVGTPEERAGTKMWPGDWIDSNPFKNHYTLDEKKGIKAFHTGADLNLPDKSDKGKPVYAIADGIVTHSDFHPESWRGLVVIDHGRLPDGTKVFARYAHVENIEVKKGDLVTRGEQISTVGLFGPVQFQNYHLHFDIAASAPGKTNILEVSPRDWPGENLGKVEAFYTKPIDFLKKHRPK
jgi:murein DD-endopeptidase MepM/ murein hydrolase activator NlpD